MRPKNFGLNAIQLRGSTHGGITLSDDLSAFEQEFNDDEQHEARAAFAPQDQKNNDDIAADLAEELYDLSDEELKARLDASAEASGAPTKKKHRAKAAASIMVWEAERAQLVTMRAEAYAKDDRKTAQAANRRINQLDASIGAKRGYFR